MRAALRRLALALATALLYPARSAAAQQGTVTFTIFAAETQAPLPGARVSVDGRPRGIADARGVVRVDGLSPGRHGVSVSLLDRIPRGLRLNLAAGEEREVMVVMEPLSLTLSPVTASARARSRDARIEGFYRRAQDHVTGRFVTRAQIEEKAAIQFTDLFRGVPGVRIDPGPQGDVIRSNRAVSMGLGQVPQNRRRGELAQGSGDCPPQYFVDGFPYRLSGSPNAEFSAADIEGVEMYFGNVPVQWGGSRAMCGVIVIWTRTNAAPATGS